MDLVLNYWSWVNECVYCVWPSRSLSLSFLFIFLTSTYICLCAKRDFPQTKSNGIFATSDKQVESILGEWWSFHVAYINQFSQISQSDPVCNLFIPVGVYWLRWSLLSHEYVFREHTHTHIHSHAFTYSSVERKIQFAQLYQHHLLDSVRSLIDISSFSDVSYTKRYGIIMKWFQMQTMQLK